MIRTTALMFFSLLLVGCGGYKLPDAAKVIEEHESSSDFQGDFSYCARFTLEEDKLEALRREGFDWFAPIREGHVSTKDWAAGVLPYNIAALINGLDVRLASGPSTSASYTYLYEWVDGGFWRLVAIDEKEKTVYYYRVSW